MLPVASRNPFLGHLGLCPRGGRTNKEGLAKYSLCRRAALLAPWRRAVFRQTLLALEGRILDVVRRRVLVRKLVDDVGALTVGVVDLDEIVPLLRQRVLGENGLDRALRFARAAVAGVDATRKRERMLVRHDRAEGVNLLRHLLDAHDAPEDLSSREV